MKTTRHHQNILDSIKKASHRVAPLWPLQNFVATNPYIGYSDHKFIDACKEHLELKGKDLLFPLSYYRNAFQNGKIGIEDLREAIELIDPEIKATFEDEDYANITPELLWQLAEKTPDDKVEDISYQISSFSHYIDHREGTHWQRLIHEEIAKWCAAYYDKGQGSWSLPWTDLNFYNAWKKAAQFDKTLAFHGIKECQEIIAKQSDDPLDCIVKNLSILSVNEVHFESFIYRLLISIPGWSGHLRYLDREGEFDGERRNNILALLAIITTYETILFNHFSNDRNRVLGWLRILDEDPEEMSPSPMSFTLAQRLIWQRALECSFESSLRSKFNPEKSIEQESITRPEAQAVFCIDVRSEILRNNLESVNPEIQTLGFAGFFGLAIEHKELGHKYGQSRCPALLKPSLKSESETLDLSEAEISKLKFLRVQEFEKDSAWKSFKSSGISGFSFIETLGGSYVFNLLRDSLGFKKSSTPSSKGRPRIVDSLSIKEKTESAEGVLKGLSLVENFAPVVLICGHGAEVKNNPYHSGLNCGACGGYAGDENARLVAALLNDFDVREALESKGINIPADTVFIAGLHNTTTDEIEIFDQSRYPATTQEKIQSLKADLTKAGDATTLARAERMDISPSSQGSVLKRVRKRSSDWSQVRPEWGLAGNAGFIVAPRKWTQGSSLKGECFLHEYDPKKDPQGIVLESVLAGPLVVGSWINLQYYASSIDNENFGSGHKSIHNITAGLGVSIGNEADIKTGLPLQSVHDGKEFAHLPRRLLACVAAEKEVIDTILSKQEHLRNLVENEWIHLISLGSDGKKWTRCRGVKNWISDIQPERTFVRSLED